MSTHSDAFLIFAGGRGPTSDLEASAAPQNKPIHWFQVGLFFFFKVTDSHEKTGLHLIGHQRGNGAADLVVLRPFSQRAEQDEEEPARHETTIFEKIFVKTK